MDGEVLIVDEHTGRMLAGRRYNEGLHQAIEAKEGVEIKRGEPDARHDHPAELLPALREALRHDRHGHDRGRRVRPDLQARRRADPDQPADGPRSTSPTSSTDRGGEVRRGRRRHRRAAREGPAGPGRHGRASRSPSTSPTSCCERGVPHEVLNAKQHEREAQIVAQAGRKGAVTVATNMAGRGTDIMLGGNPEFLADAELRAAGPRPGRDAGGVRGRLARRAREGQGGRSQAEHDEVVDARRPLRPRHRAARVAPHRQPAARPLRPPGRPGRVPVLPLARGRPDAAVQRRRGRPRS